MGTPCLRWALWGSVTWLSAAGCLYDDDDRCGPNQRPNDYNRCVCVEGTALVGGQCVDCGPHARVEADACACLAGYERASPGADCEPTQTGLGEPCTTSAECPAPFTLCHLTPDALGYCTQACSSSAECSGGYACNVRRGEPFCDRPPTGLGTPCRAEADCAGLEADFCENVLTNSCVVDGCSADDQCHGDWVCCDFAQLGYPITLCVPPEDCPTR